jgi:hypothetical protein
MGMLTVKFQNQTLLHFDGTQENIVALKAEAEAMAFDVSQFVQAQMRNLISAGPVTEIMLTCVLYRVVTTIGDQLLVSHSTVSVVPDAAYPDGYRVIVEP